MAATPVEIQKAAQFKIAQAKNLRGIDPLRTAPPSKEKFQSETADQTPEPLFAEEPGAAIPPASPSGTAREGAVVGATSGLLRGAWSSLPFGLLNPFLGLLSLIYINIHFILAYVGGPISQFFSKFGTEWLEQLGAVKATGAGGAAVGGVEAIKKTAAGKLLAAILELGEIFVLLVLDSFAVLAALLAIALVGALMRAVGAPLEVIPGLAA